MRICPRCGKTYEDDAKFCTEDGEQLQVDTPPTDPMIGRTFEDRYNIIDRIGGGGMGTVYKAQHLNMNRIVAVKMLHATLAYDDDSIKRFQREAEAASQFNHPNSVIIHDYGLTEEGIPFIVMDWADGRNLKKVIQDEGPLPLERTAGIGKQICAALSAAHRSNIVHRDLKPENVIVSETPEGADFIKVVDFGIAKIAKPSDDRTWTFKTQTGIIFGTPQYMSPEQCRGEKDIDGRSDIYSLGIILYEMLSGETPFSSTTPGALLIKHVTEPPIPLREISPDLDAPPAVEKVIMKCLEKSKEKRQQSTDELADELDDALKGIMPTSVQSRSVARFPSLSKLAAAVAVLCILAVGGVYIYPRLKDSLTRTPDSRTGTTDTHTATVQKPKDGEESFAQELFNKGKKSLDQAVKEQDLSKLEGAKGEFDDVLDTRPSDELKIKALCLKAVCDGHKELLLRSDINDAYGYYQKAADYGVEEQEVGVLEKSLCQTAVKAIRSEMKKRSWQEAIKKCDSVLALKGKSASTENEKTFCSSVKTFCTNALAFANAAKTLDREKLSEISRQLAEVPYDIKEAAGLRIVCDGYISLLDGDLEEVANLTDSLSSYALTVWDNEIKTLRDQGYSRASAQAKEHMAAKKWDEAINSWMTALKFRAADPDATYSSFFSKGESDMLSSDWESAASNFGRALEAKPDSEGAKYLKSVSEAYSCLEKGDISQAAIHVRAASKVPVNRGEIETCRAKGYDEAVKKARDLMQREEWAEASQTWRAALDFNPEDALKNSEANYYLHFTSAKDLIAKKKWQEADKAIADAINKGGAGDETRKQEADALKSFSWAEGYKAALDQVRTGIEKEQWEDAKHQAEEALDYYGQDDEKKNEVNYWRQIVEAQKELGAANLEAAAQAARSALGYNASGAEAESVLAACYEQQLERAKKAKDQQQWEQTAENAQGALKFQPEGKEAQGLLASVYSRLVSEIRDKMKGKDWSNAGLKIEAIKKLYPNRESDITKLEWEIREKGWDYWCKDGEKKMEEGDFRAAAKSLEQALNFQQEQEPAQEWKNVADIVVSLIDRFEELKKVEDKEVKPRVESIAHDVVNLLEGELKTLADTDNARTRMASAREKMKEVEAYVDNHENQYKPNVFDFFYKGSLWQDVKAATNDLRSRAQNYKRMAMSKEARTLTVAQRDLLFRKANFLPKVIEKLNAMLQEVEAAEASLDVYEKKLQNECNEKIKAREREINERRRVLKGG